MDQIGVEPGPELRRLQDAVLAQDPALELPAAPTSTPAAAAPSSAAPAARVLARAALLTLAGLAAFGASRLLAPDRLPRIDENHVGLIDPDDGRITEQYAVGREPGAMVAGAGSLWVANTRDETVSRIDRDAPGRLDRRRRRAHGARFRGRLIVGRRRRRLAPWPRSIPARTGS